jgi:hypothetical protein
MVLSKILHLLTLTLTVRYAYRRHNLFAYT